MGGIIPTNNAVRGVSLIGFTFLMHDARGSPLTGLLVNASRSIDRGPFCSCVNWPVEIGGGYYAIDLVAAELRGVLVLAFEAPGAVRTMVQIRTVEQMGSPTIRASSGPWKPWWAA